MIYEKKKLSNGLRVIVAPLRETKTMTLLVLVKVGSRYEQVAVNGVSHFIEHLMFKGTDRRPTTLDISRELDGVGAEYNAFTAKDHTGYYIKASHRHLELAFDILSDMLFHSRCDPAEIRRERKVLIEEINMYKDNPMMYIESLFEELLYGKKNFLGQFISGPKSVIRRISRESILACRDRFYDPKNMLVVVSGKTNPSEVIRLARRYFSSRGQRKMIPLFKRVTVLKDHPRVAVEFKETEQVQLCLGFPGYSYFDPKLEAAFLLSVILGGNMSSRLFINIRERLGLCYFIRSSLNIYEDTGNFVIQAGLDRKRIREAILKMIEELKRVKNDGVKEDELLKAKEYLRGKLTLEMEDSEHIANWYGAQELLTRRILTLEERFRKIEKVKVESLRKVACDLFQTSNTNLALVGPFRRSQEFVSLLNVEL